MIALIDYGVGNLFSLNCSFRAVGADAVVTGDPKKIAACDKIVLPGVGAFGDAAKKLFDTGLADVLRTEVLRGKPLLGICLGMQLLLTESLEYGRHTGLDLIPGRVVPLNGAIPESLKIPHIGWNGLRFPDQKPKSRLFSGVNPNDCVYFVHSYHGALDPKFISATCEYGADLTAAIERPPVYGVQFHPEKSGEAGLKILRAFCDL